MIQSVSAIEKEFLIKTVAQNEQPVRLHGISTIGTGVITLIDRSSLALNLLNTFDNIPFSVCEHITGYFDCHGSTYAFETTVRNTKQNEIKIDPPVRLLKSLQRKYVRVRKPRDLSVAFHLANEDIVLDYPVCPEYISVEANAKKEGTENKRIPELVSAFRDRLGETCTESTIIMFRNKKPSSFEEELVSKTGKILFIPSTSSGLPAKDPYPEGRIITWEIEEQFEDPNYFIEGSHFEKLLAEKKARGISSEIWCPIVYYQYVVGYILARNVQGESLDISTLEYMWDFSRILAWQLRQTGYFNTETEKKEARRHRAGVLDISPGGMLISLPQNEIRTPIREGSVFSVEICPGTERIVCSARVVRRYEENGTVIYGTMFTDLSPENLMMLYEFLYRKPYATTNPLAYEQQS